MRFPPPVQARFHGPVGEVAAGKATPDVGGVFIFLWLWLVQAVFAIVLSAPLLFLARKQVIWRPWESLIFVLPYAVWTACMLIDDTGKSLANLGECILIACIIPVAVLTRIVTPAHKWQWLYSSILIGAMCLVAVMVYLLTPPLPE